jgi:hypothetical protein
MKEHFSIVRAHVIKTLYENYSLFQKRSNKTDAIQKDPHFLLSSRCVRMWYSKRSIPHQSYNYYFEFRFDHTQRDILIPPLSPLFRVDNQYIIDKNTCILHLISSNFVPIGPYMGMILCKLTLNISSDHCANNHNILMRYYLCNILPVSYHSSVILLLPNDLDVKTLVISMPYISCYPSS